jgi:hypothetical protein
VTWKELVALAKKLPEVTEKPWYGTPGLAVRGKGFVRLKEDKQTVVFVLESVDEQEALIETQPDIFFITDHYRGYAAVLARLAVLVPVEARLRLERAWRAKAPRALVTALDATSATARRSTRRRASPARRGSRRAAR